MSAEQRDVLNDVLNDDQYNDVSPHCPPHSWSLLLLVLFFSWS